MDPDKLNEHRALLARMGMMVHTDVYGPTDMTDEAVQTRMRTVAKTATNTPSSFNLQNDFDLGNQVRMLTRRDSAHEGVVCAARDRIFQLSLRVAELEGALSGVRDNLVRLAWDENSIMVEGINAVLTKSVQP